MKMNLLIMSKLLFTCTSFILAGYLIFSLNIIILVWSSIQINDYLIILPILIFSLLAIHHFIFIRVKFDASLLHMLYREAQHQSIKILTQQLDQSLLDLNMIPLNKANRPWEQRLQGCFKLYKIQITILIAQAITLFFTLYIDILWVKNL